MTWHRPARVIVGVVACASAVGAYLTVTRRPPAVPPPPIERSDPTAVLESREAVLQQVRLAEERFEVRADKTLHYNDGSTRQYGVRVSVRNRSGRDFVVTAAEARAGKDAMDLELSGQVRLTASDGFELSADAATYAKGQGLVQAPGDVTFKKGRLAGSATGMSYDTNAELLSLLANPDVRLAPDGVEDAAESDGMQFRAGTARLDRIQHVLTLEQAATVARGPQVLSGEMVVARLSEDEQRVTVVELHERASVTGGTGSLDRMTARDMTLQYAEDGTTLERALLRGDALVVATASSPRAPQRRFGGGTLDIDLDAEGHLVRAIGRDGIRVDLPGPGAGSGQVVLGREFESSHDGTGALSGLLVNENVSYREEGSGRKARIAKGRVLRLGIEDESVRSAVFGGGASFEEGPLSAAADEIRYDLAGGRLTLAAGDAVPEPRMEDDRLTMTAKKIGLALGSKDVTASGGVKTVLRPSADKTSEGGGQRLPGILAQGQLVNINADGLTSEGGGGRMEYVGTAMLWQGETAMRADSLTIDRDNGSLEARGSARVTLPMSDGPASGRARSIRFDDATRTLVLDTPVEPVAAGVGGARAPAVEAAPGSQSYLSAAHGEVRAERIALVLLAGSSATDRLEATGDVSLRAGARRASSAKLTYDAREGRYELTGTAARPVSVIESCRATTGKTLIFYRSTDRILVDGNEEIRTQTKSGGSCVPTTR